MTAIYFFVKINTNGLNIMNENEDLLDGGTFSFLPFALSEEIIFANNTWALGEKDTLEFCIWLRVKKRASALP